MELEMHRTPALLSDLVPDLYFFPDLEPEMGSQRPRDVNIDEFKIQNFKIIISNFQLTRPGFHFEVPKTYKVVTKTHFHMKDTGKSSSRQLRGVIYYTLYKMDPQKAHYKISFFATMSKIKKWENPYIRRPLQGSPGV